MGLNVNGNVIVGEIKQAEPTARNIRDLIASGEFSIGAPVQPAARSIRDLVADQLEVRSAEQIVREIEERNALPIDHDRPIFNSLIDRKENSRYMLDLVKV